MSLAADSPVHSSSTSSNDFAAFLNAELDSASDVSSSSEREGGVEEKEAKEEEYEGDDTDNNDLQLERIKRCKVEVLESSIELQTSTSQGGVAQTSGASSEMDVCTHPGVIGGLCIQCGQKMDDESGVAFGYIYKNLRLANEEIARLCDKDLRTCFAIKNFT
ncbi:hypothetical protein ACH5RR_006611 [Cinchona calisaya]|uniref:Uncharacterized protein n=1 Tax=Cinchona calisaya TaxID=153742 RepID=A0ABD3APH6_9GENT